MIGPGPIGLELALAHRRLGSDVTVVGRGVRPWEEPSVQSFVAASK